MFFQASDTNSDILENIIEGRITETRGSTSSNIPDIGEEAWADLVSTFRSRHELKSAIRDHFFGRPEPPVDKDVLATQIEKTSPSEFEGKNIWRLSWNHTRTCNTRRCGSSIKLTIRGAQPKLRANIT